MENTNDQGGEQGAADPLEAAMEEAAGAPETEQTEETMPGTEPIEGETTEGEEGAAPVEPAYVQELRQQVADMREWREAQEKRFAEEQKPAAPEPPAERTPEMWNNIESHFGFSKVKDAEGNESLHITPQKMIAGIEGLVNHVANKIREEFEGKLHENVSPFKLEPVFADLEKRREAPLPDIRQFSSAIREYLKGRYHPRDHANPKHVEDAYYWAKGRGMRDAVKRIESKREVQKKVIHPAGGGGASAKKPISRRPGPVNGEVDAFLLRAGWK